MGSKSRQSSFHVLDEIAELFAGLLCVTKRNNEKNGKPECSTSPNRRFTGIQGIGKRSIPRNREEYKDEDSDEHMPCSFSLSITSEI